jgi:hypothetical protein
MGRTIPSFRIALVHEEMQWRIFRNSLDKSYKKSFDRLFAISRLYISASMMSAMPVRIYPIMMSMIFHHYKQITLASEKK